ncbi:MAG: hypothetical protein GF383_05115 [Candidatus Lokiarchaeota archaeon]|nr:hypothetical protein [Candidatus Lokiarchaeota archaeon]MBD3339272.1 hypothetical protein [Candidatus Lokiarchaeota archaeon]
MKRKAISIILTAFVFSLIIVSLVPTTINSEGTASSSVSSNFNHISDEDLKTSSDLEAIDDVLITYLKREAIISGYDIVNVDDTLVVKNFNNNPITYILIGIDKAQTENLIFFEAVGNDENTLTTEKTKLTMDNFEMFLIYFESPLNPSQSVQITFRQSYKDQLDYIRETPTAQQTINYSTYVFPILPYEAEGSITAVYEYPSGSQLISFSDWGTEQTGDNTITYTKTELEPFLENLRSSNEDIINIHASNTVFTKLEAEEIDRKILISPWGTIKVEEEYQLINKGKIDVDDLSLEIPGPAESVFVFDDLGEILGVDIYPEEEYYNLTKKELDIDLDENRVTIEPNTKFKFSIEYYLPVEKYITLNWLQQTFEIDALTTVFEFLGKDQTIKIEIEACFSLDSVSESPDAIEHGQNSLILVYKSDYVSPIENKDMLFTYTVNFFDLIFRPFLFMLIIVAVLSLYIVFIKTRKEEAIGAMVLRKEMIPVNELREYISLYEEKNALVIEMREAEEDVKRKKIIKKKYKNIIDKNTARIKEIEKEIQPFKETIRETNQTFENIVKKLEVLEAERLSVNDSLNLLEARYKRGRLPSKAAYLKLSDNFLRRQKKIDRSIDKNIQALRSYLL